HAPTDQVEAIYGPALKAWVADNTRRLDEFDLLAGLQAGHRTLKDGTLTFREKLYFPKDIATLLQDVQRELDEDQRYKADVDARVFRLHWRMAQQLGNGAEETLVERYRFHHAIQTMHRDIIQACQDTQPVLS